MQRHIFSKSLRLWRKSTPHMLELQAEKELFLLVLRLGQPLRYFGRPADFVIHTFAMDRADSLCNARGTIQIFRSIGKNITTVRKKAL